MTDFYGVVGTEESALEAANRRLAKKAAKEDVRTSACRVLRMMLAAAVPVVVE